MYRISDQAAPLAQQRVDVDTYVGENPGLPADQVRAAANAHNAAIDLALGEGEFAELFEANAAPGDPGPTAVAVESITIELKGKLPWQRLDAALIQARITALAQIDVAHPFVRHWRVLHARCYPYQDDVPAWTEIASHIDAKALFDAGPQLGQPCRFLAADASERAGKITHIWGPTMVNLEFQDDGGAMATATSVRVVMSAAEGDRYCCVLLPA